MNLIVIFIWMASIIPAYAGELSLIDKNLEVKKEHVQETQVIKPEDTQNKNIPQQDILNGDFEQMKEFMQKENEKIKDIKILNLDLERAQLELQKKEIEVKLADLNKGHSIYQGHASDGLIAPASAVKVMGIFVNGPLHSAWMDCNGKYTQVKEGEYLPNGILVKSIKADQVTLEHADGKQELINFRS